MSSFLAAPGRERELHSSDGPLSQGEIPPHAFLVVFPFELLLLRRIRTSEGQHCSESTSSAAVATRSEVDQVQIVLQNLQLSAFNFQRASDTVNMFKVLQYFEWAKMCARYA